ncbi:PQQ-binding-like beta-propeller repeat protein [Nonomuraea rubra]|uniref:outer membrane protein assembly factor BamB family protein n=1 Tax=Nonomuraea rubra TaxID=46180 RepID=UPI0033DEC4E2
MERRNFLLGAAATLTATAATAEPAQARPLERQPASLGVTGRDFPKVCGNLGNHNYSPLKQITARTVRRLGGAWHVNLEGGSTSAAQQSTCVVENGVLYVQTTQQNVFAVDGRTGAIKWKTNLGSKQTNSRGVALGEGLVFSTSGTNFVYALKQDTGQIAWQRQFITDGEGGGDTGGCDPQNGQCGASTSGTG